MEIDFQIKAPLIDLQIRPSGVEVILDFHHSPSPPGDPFLRLTPSGGEEIENLSNNHSAKNLVEKSVA